MFPFLHHNLYRTNFLASFICLYILYLINVTSHEMRRCKIVTWILILSIVNFALGAPAAVRERLVISADVDVAERGIGTSRKRYDPLDDSSTTNIAERPPTPPMRSQSEIDQLWEDVERGPYDRHTPPTPDSPNSSESVDSNWLNSDSESPTSHTSPTGGSPPPLPHPGPLEYYLPSPPRQSVNPDTLSSTVHQPTPPHSPAGSLLLNLVNPDRSPSTGRQPVPPHSPAGAPPLLHPVNPDRSPSTSHQPAPPHSPAGAPPLLHPVNPDGSLSIGHQPTPPQSPGEPDVHSLLSPEPFPNEFWDDFLKGNIRPRNSRISGSDAVNLDRTDSRSRIF